VSDLLSADEEAQLLRDLDTTAAQLARTANDLAAVPPVSIDTETVREAMHLIQPIVTRLRARGSPGARTQVNKALGVVEKVIGGQFATALQRALLARTPLPGGPAAEGLGPNAIDLAELYRATIDWLIRRDPKHPAISDLRRGLVPLVERTKAYAEGAEAELDSPDYPDLAGIAANVLRLDVLTWILVTAGFQREALDVQARTRRLARAALRRATAVMNRCSETFALPDRINLAGTLAEIDDLVLIFQRVREGEREEMPSGDDSFVQSLGAQVIADLTSAVTQLARNIMDSFVAGALDMADASCCNDVAGMLRALGKLRHFLIGVKDHGTQAAVQQMTREFRSGFLKIGQHMARSAERARAEHNMQRLTQIEIIHQAFAVLVGAMEPAS
jgi:hypothetical protein